MGLSRIFRRRTSKAALDEALRRIDTLAEENETLRHELAQTADTLRQTTLGNTGLLETIDMLKKQAALAENAANERNALATALSDALSRIAENDRTIARYRTTIRNLTRRIREKERTENTPPEPIDTIDMEMRDDPPRPAAPASPRHTQAQPQRLDFGKTSIDTPKNTPDWLTPP